MKTLAIIGFVASLVLAAVTLGSYFVAQWATLGILTAYAVVAFGTIFAIVAHAWADY